ncbi:MAG: alpha/beta hydrolase [Bacteroidota bacterium]
MKIFLNILKWTGLSIGSILALIILAGLSFRLFGPRPNPPGELVDVGDFNLHIHSTGKKSNMPTLILETGQGIPSEHYHWLSEGLKDSMRVVRYDRAGIGYSDLSHTPRDPSTIAQELHTLLEKAGEEPPYILAGHSFGGLYIRVFTQLYPDEVVGMAFLDSSHPDQQDRLNHPEPRDISWILNAVAVLGDVGILGLLDRYKGSIISSEDLPEEVNERFLDYTLDGKYIRGLRDETKWDQATFDQAREAKEFGSLPIRVFTANKKYSGKEANPKWIELQREIADLSTNNKHILIDGHHNSIYTAKENADVICKEILQLAKTKEGLTYQAVANTSLKK